MSYPIKQLSQLCDISIGRTPARKEPDYWGKGNKWVSISDLTSKVVCDTKEEITDFAVTKTRCRKVPKGTLLFSFKLTIGKMAFAGCDLYTNEAIAALHIKNNDELYGEYLFFALQVAKLLGSNQAVMGKTLNSKSLAQIEIPVPEEIADQKRIAHLLGKVEGLIARRKQHLQQLDDLLKSLFLEMFGDIRAKKSPHPWEKLRPYLNARSGKSNKGIISEVKTDFPIYGGNGVNGWSTKPLYNEPVIVAGRVGQQCGIIHVTTGACWVTDNAIAIEITDLTRLNTIYLSTAFQYAPIREKVKQLDLPFINQSMLLDYPLPLPPIDLQNQFAAIVEKVEGLKSRYQQSLTDLESLYGALSQKAFKGELDLSRVVLTTEDTESTEEINHERHEKHEMEKDTVELPAPSDLESVKSAEGRKALIDTWLTAWLEQLGDAPFVAQAFMDAARQRLWELAEDEAPDWGVAEYDELKAWMFEALEQGRLIQGYDDANNRVQITAVKG